MFTGLIEATGTVERIEPAGSARTLTIATRLGAELSPGDSIAVNGVCLTATSTGANWFGATVSPETLRVTTLGGFREGRLVNLERPLRADGRVGGHFVLGHVDAVGRVVSIEPDGDCVWLTVDLPPAVAALVIHKGSIAIDGISLTIASIDGTRVGVQIVPHTWAHAALPQARPGDEVNLEADVIGKYVARLLVGVTAR
jgi:riboflavin synthase